MKTAATFLITLFTLMPFSMASADWTPGDSTAVELPELNIVAIKQSASLNSQAVSATTLRESQILLDNIVDIKRLSDIVPNFYIPDYGSRITSSIYVRGIGARMDQPSVGLTIDNMPVLNKDAYDLDLPDIAEIEMLRGPQSSLYGRNTMCGLINIRTLSPLSYQGWKLLAEGTFNGSFKANAGWYHKFRDTMGLSANVAFNALRGDYKNAYNDKRVRSEKSGSARIKFEWVLPSGLSLLNTLSTSVLHQSGYAYESAVTKQINYNDTCFYRRFLISDVLTLSKDFDRWKLTGIASVQHINDNMTLDQDFLPESYFTLTQKKQATDLTAEVVAQRTGTHKYNWIFGAFGFYRHMDMQAPVTFKEAGIANLIEYYPNKYNPYYPMRWDSNRFPLLSDFTQPSFGVAVYHESKLSLGNFVLTGALRLDYETSKLHYTSRTSASYTVYSNPSGNPDTPQADWTFYRNNQIEIDDRGTLDEHFLTLLPQASLLYNLPSGIGNVYASFGKGYKAGGFNTQMFSDVLQQRLMSMLGIHGSYDPNEIVKYKPEYSFNYELGSHLDFSSLSESRWSNLTLDVSLFYIDCRDQQLTMFPKGTTTGRIMANAGKTRSFGGELALSWLPTEALVINCNYGYTNARFVSYFDGIDDFKGKRLPYAPENTIFGQAVYTLSTKTLGQNRIIFDVNVRATGNIYWNEANTLSQPLYAILGASVTFKAPKWEVQLWGRNLTDTSYHTFYFMSMGNEFLQRGNPISGGVTLRVNI